MTGLSKGTACSFRVFAQDPYGNVGYCRGHEVGTLPLGQERGGLSPGAWVGIMAAVGITSALLLTERSWGASRGPLPANAGGPRGTIIYAQVR